jgi:hypothetical protein
MMSFYNKILYTGYIEKDRVVSNVISGINLILADPEFVKLNDSTLFSLFGGYNDSVLLEHKQWGVFENVICRSWWKNFQYEKLALTGNFYKDDSTYAIYLVDENKPLSLCGNTTINGNCYLPKAGVKRAYIEGRNFEGKELINGKVNFSSGSLPETDTIYQHFDQEYFKEKYFKSEKTMKILAENVTDDSLTNSFNNETVLIYSTDDYQLNNKYLKGNIVLLCEGGIEISKSNRLEDILIYARSIWIEEGFNGKIQLFAKDTINIDQNCKLNYPSSIGLINHNEEGNTNPSIVVLEKGTIFSGILYSACKSNVITIEPILILNEGTVIKGQVFWEGIVDFKGEIDGSIACKKFLLKTPSSIYENHLLDVTIDMNKLSDYYTGVSLVSSQKPGKIIKWLY